MKLENLSAAAAAAAAVAAEVTGALREIRMSVPTEGRRSTSSVMQITSKGASGLRNFETYEPSIIIKYCYRVHS